MNLSTRTGAFPIGVRRGWTDWQQDVNGFAAWCKQNDLGVVDLGRNLDELRAVRGAGLEVGSVDLLDWGGLLAENDETRKKSVESNAAYVRQACSEGATNFFCVMLPEDTTRARHLNFDSMVSSLAELAPTLEEAGGRLAIEGYPGDGALCCTPESYRATFEKVPSLSIGINYDPSHLLRMGIDPLRFLKEFAPRVGHVHGKDCEVLTDDLYEYGYEQPATFKKSPDFGAASWRYTIPGHGNSNWSEIFRILQGAGYGGAVCIELEDKDYNGTDDGERAGILSGARFLSDC